MWPALPIFGASGGWWLSSMLRRVALRGRDRTGRRLIHPSTAFPGIRTPTLRTPGTHTMLPMMLFTALTALQLRSAATGDPIGVCALSPTGESSTVPRPWKSLDPRPSRSAVMAGAERQASSGVAPDHRGPEYSRTRGWEKTVEGGENYGRIQFVSRSKRVS